MPRAKPPLYHKKNLREKLLRETARVVSRDGVQGVSMRRLSERLDISRTAAYHHFASKEALLAAVGQDGFRRLGLRLAAAIGDRASSLERLRAGLRAYLSFAREETEFFRLMFSDVLERPLADADVAPFPFSSAEAQAAFDTLLATVRTCQTEGSLPPGEPLLFTNALWAFTHGVACLAIGDHLKITGQPDQLLGEGLTALIEGFQRRKPPIRGPRSSRVG